MNPEAAPILETTALCKSFGGIAAVRDVSITSGVASCTP